MFDVLDISSSALAAQRTQMDVIAGNIAMREAVRFVDGEAVPYRRRVALLAEGDPTRGGKKPGVHVADIVEDATPFGLKWDPTNPSAVREGGQKGYVRLSNVDYFTEMVNAMTAVRAYEANVTVMEMAKSTASNLLRLIA